MSKIKVIKDFRQNIKKKFDEIIEKNKLNELKNTYKDLLKNKFKEIQQKNILKEINYVLQKEIENDNENSQFAIYLKKIKKKLKNNEITVKEAQAKFFSLKKDIKEY